MIIKNIENKFKLSLFISLGSFITSIVIVFIGFGFSYNLVANSNKKIYVLDNGVPVLVQQTNLDVNRKVEYESHVSLFHMLFFSLPPDDQFIKNNISKAMYLIDQSGQIEYNNLREKGYYNAIMSSSAVLSIRTDSVKVDLDNHTFTYYGTQRIERQSSILTRELVTSGMIRDVPRSDNNPHGCIITNWKTILNKDISNVPKKTF